MNEKGFFTLIALGLFLVAALMIKLIQTAETDNANISANFMIEAELQNAADSALNEAVEKISADKNYLSSTLIFSDSKFSEQMKKNISVQVYVKDGTIHTEAGTYYDKDIPSDKDGRIFMSVASCDSDFILDKVYRRTFAYVYKNDTDKNIRYMNSLTGSD